MPRPEPKARLAFLLAAASLAVLASAFPAVGQRRPAGLDATAPRADRTAAVDPMRHLHRDATSFGRIDLARLRSFRHFRRIVRHGVQQLDAPTRAISRIRAMLEHTDTIYVSMVRGPGRTADVATVLLHGTYQPNEVPSAVQSLLPGLLQGLWAEGNIDGHVAFDVGVGALVRLSDHDWLLARRIGTELPVTPRDPPPALAGTEYQRLAGLAGFGQSVAEGVLVGAADTESAQLPPDGPGFLYHRTRAAYGNLSLAEAAEARFAFEMHTDAGARWRAEHLRDLLGRLARDLRDEQGAAGSELRFTVEQTGTTVRVDLSLDPAQVDAYVARFLAGRLLSGAPESAPADASR